nr:LysR family transcriptional regulator [uncultured Roseococcus sp.]
MNLASLDLNLLVAFDALMQERNVTRAGQRIGLAQPSMSSALTRLRALLGDQLFIRTGTGMKPTERALALAGPVGDALEQLREALERGKSFDPATARHRFTIAATDYGNLVVMPALVRALRQQAPGVDLLVKATLDRAETLKLVERGEIDALVGGHLPDSPLTLRHTLFLERFACIQDAAHANPSGVLSREDYLRLPHAWFSSDGSSGAGVMDAVLAEHGAKRRIAVSLPHIVAVPFAVAGTDLIATMAESVARRFAETTGVVCRAVPFDAEPFRVDLVYARKGSGAPPMRWLIDFIKREVRLPMASMPARPER